MIKKDLRKHRTFRLTDEEFAQIEELDKKLIKMNSRRPSHGLAVATAVRMALSSLACSAAEVPYETP